MSNLLGRLGAYISHFFIYKGFGIASLLFCTFFFVVGNMVAPKVYKALLWVQGLYTLLTALWGLIDIDSFMAVTGPKNDIWLVKTVSAILLAIALTLISYVYIKTNPLPAILLGFFTSAGLAAIDFYYSSREVISPVYALDGIAEVVFALVWIYLLRHRRHLYKP